jgi:cytochrome c oxidase assembly protein subunit 11
MNNSLVGKLLVITAIMFGFGYALVPLYDIFCEVTGFGGKTDTLAKSENGEQIEKFEIDENRLVRLQFTGHAATPLPWDFKAETFQAELKPGQLYEFYYVAKNNGLTDITAQSTFNVTPAIAGGYIKKLECFCFTQQTLKAGEEVRMLVRMLVDPALPVNINELTLGYSFFQAKS